MGIKGRLFVILVLLGASLQISAQEKVEHTIVPGNTIFGLAKEYGSTVEAIYDANPNIAVRSLVVGDQIIIPIPAKEVIDSSRYIFHTVRSFESVYSISRKHNVKDSTIYWHNPVLKNSPIVKKDQILRIPKNAESWLPKHEEFLTLKPNDVPKYEVYIVKEGDSPHTLYRAWGYENVEEFYSINPDTRVDWYVGMTLVKPIHPIDRSNKVIDHSLVSQGLQVSSRLDNTQKITESNGDSLDVRFSGKSAESMIPKGNTKMEINILGLLPFFVKDYVNETPIARRSIIAMSFRQGMEAAAALWLDTNSTVNLHYADTYNNDDSIRTALSEPKADSLDLIIGPLYAERMINLAINTDPELLVSPLSKSPSIGNAGVWNAVVSEEVLWEGVWSYLDQKINHNKTTNKPQKLLLVGTKSSKNNSLSGKAVTIFGESIVKVVLNDESWVQNEQLARLDTSVLYNLVLLDNDPAFLLDALRNLREGRAKYHWIAQERQIVDRGLVNNVFERENITTIYSGYIDYTLKETLDFVAFFREKFGREPDKYAFIAYDITTFHMKRLVYRQHSWRGISLGFDYSTGQRFNSYTETRVYKNHSWQLTNATLAK